MKKKLPKNIYTEVSIISPQKHGHKKFSFMKICLMSFVLFVKGSAAIDRRRTPKALDGVVGAIEAQLKKLRTIAMLDIPATGGWTWGVCWRLGWFGINKTSNILGWTEMWCVWNLSCLLLDTCFVCIVEINLKGVSRMLLELVLSKIGGRIGLFSVPTPNVVDV